MVILTNSFPLTRHFPNVKQYSQEHDNDVLSKMDLRGIATVCDFSEVPVN